jgi:peptide/nickel transport system substrate-binding protein
MAFRFSNGEIGPRIGLWFVCTCCAAVMGCLSPDPGKAVSGFESRQDHQDAVHRETRAPKTIDPAIWSSRAFGEAPQLRERVATGDLPPVSERLPDHPLVVIPVDTIGIYGGMIRRALTGDIVQTAGPAKTLNENLMGFSRPLPDSIVLGLAESYEFLDGGRTALFYLRKGVKWSDGHPFTVDDILFWYYDMVFDDNARADPFPPAGWIVDGKPMRFEKVDEVTLKIVSPKPMGRVLQEVCRDLVAAPRHVLAPFHPRYNHLATYESFRDSTTSASLILKPGIPRLSAWVPVSWERGQRILYARNPYYWKVDTAGNQLPYADSLAFNIIQDTQVILLRFMNGELDLFGRYSRIDMLPTLKTEERKGKFAVRITGPGRGPAYHVNWDCPRPLLREAFRDKNVRMALSHAINREEINEIVFQGLLDAAGFSFGPLSPYFDEKMYRKYADYDPALSRRLLDAAGYRDADGDGFREFKDGSRFELTIDYVSPGGFFSDQAVSELVSAHWEAVGIQVHLNGALRDIIVPRRYNNEYDVHYWGLEGPNDPLFYAIGWGIMAKNVPYWHQHAFEEGPEWLWEVTDHLKQAMTTVDTTQLRVHMSRARDLHSENVPIIALGSLYNVWGATTRLGNVPLENIGDNAFLGWSRPVFHEQIYFKRP